MEQSMPFGEVLEAIERLSPEDQETLIDVVRHRMAERGRKILAAEIKDARKEFAEGQCQSASAERIMKEILS